MWRAAILALRPHQWVKNLFLFAPLLFARSYTSLEAVVAAVAGFLVFCLLSGAVYVINDLADLPRDRVHPTKRYRPIASGALPAGVARRMAVGLPILAVAGGFGLDRGLGLGRSFGLLAVAYLVLNLAYSAVLKRVVFLDVLAIAAGFLLRVSAGAVVIGQRISGWLLLCTFLLATFLGLGKRKHELRQAGNGGARQRAVLARYRMSHIDLGLAIAGLATLTSYTAYTLAAETARHLGTRRLVLTVPFVAFGIVRYLKLTSRDGSGESPTDQMVRDLPLVVNTLLWVLVVLMLLSP